MTDMPGESHRSEGLRIICSDYTVGQRWHESHNAHQGKWQMGRVTGCDVGGS